MQVWEAFYRSILTERRDGRTLTVKEMRERLLPAGRNYTEWNSEFEGTYVPMCPLVGVISLDLAPAEALQAGRTHSTVALQSLSEPSNTSEVKGALSSGETEVSFLANQLVWTQAKRPGKAVPIGRKLARRDTGANWGLCHCSSPTRSDQQAESSLWNLHVVEKAENDTKNHLDNSQDNWHLHLIGVQEC